MLSASNHAAPDRVHYIVVIHGMGEPREGETVLPVINRIAEARSAELGKIVRLSTKENIISLGKMLGQSREKNWIEFKGIPSTLSSPCIGCGCAGDHAEEDAFLGEACDCGTNIRFADLWWGDITSDKFRQAGEPVNRWTRALVNRVDMRMKRSQARQKSASEVWSFGIEAQLQALLENLRKTLIPIQTALSFRFKGFSDLIFNRFLGDVQLYGEFAQCRLDASVRFHDRMQALHESHWKAEKTRFPNPEEQRAPVYHILAHSLGTIMSLDALVAAKRNRRDWVSYVESYVTLGSPIDKFIMLWPENYTHLDDPKHPYWADFDWSDPDATGRKIRHFNFCDEQDPVGHNLDLLHHNTVVKTFFDLIEDKVYVRYPVVGKAHVDYWKDSDLFRHILNVTVDGKMPQQTASGKKSLRQNVTGMVERLMRKNTTAKTQNANEAWPVRWYSPEVYQQVMRISYTIIPLLFWIGLTTGLLFFTVNPSIIQKVTRTELMLAFQEGQMLPRTLFALLLLGGYSFLELISAGTNWSWQEWLGKSKGDFLVWMFGLAFFLPTAFFGIVLVGLGGMLMILTMVAYTWVYYRLMELIIQWRQMTVMLTDSTNQDATTLLENRTSKRFWLRMRILAMGIITPVVFTLFLTHWLDRILDWHVIYGKDHPVLQNVVGHISTFVTDFVASFEMVGILLGFQDAEDFLIVAFMTFFMITFSGAIIYSYRAAKFFYERKRTRILKAMMQQHVRGAELKDAPSQPVQGTITQIHAIYRGETSQGTNKP